MEFKLNSEYKSQLRKNKLLIWITKHSTVRMYEKVFDWKNWAHTIGMPLMLFSPLIYKAIEKYLVTSNKLTISVEMTLIKMVVGGALCVTFPFIAIMFFAIYRTSFFKIFVVRCLYDLVYAICYPYYLIKQNTSK